ncbi:MAG TPA: polysaccharide biosynthesis tyrosine autokinase [Candidatus Aminicenantes bacterium]|nr:polysaccharide biosynthesis tyrosine autokinase [Candidatus Aminicenantes bacterium]
MATKEINEDVLQEEGVQFHEYWDLIKKQYRLVLFVAGIVLLAALVRVNLQTPFYRAQGILLIEKEGRSQMNLLNQYYAYDNDWMNEYLNTQIRVLTSRSLARKVIEELGKMPGNEKKPAPKAAPPAKNGGAGKAPDPRAQISGAISGFLGGLGVENIEDTRLLEVSYVSADPNMAAYAVNTLFDKFVEFNLEMKAESSQQASEFLTTQIEDMRRTLAQKEQELQEYGKRKELYYIRGEDSTVVQKLSDLNAAYTAAQIDRVNREATYRELRDKSYDNYSEVRASTLVQNLKQEYSAKESEYKRKSQIFQDSYPEMQRLKSQLDGLQKRIAEETADVARKVLNQAQAEYQAALKKENSLQDMLNQQKGSVVSSNANAIYYNSLKIEVDNLRSLLEHLTRKEKESMLSARLEGTQTSNIKIVDRAEIPAAPFSPNKRRTLLMALILGLGAGVFLVFALRYLDNTLKSPEDAEKLLHIPALGLIPDINIKSGKTFYHPYYSERQREHVEKKIDTIEMVNLKEPESTIAEHYRYIRTSLLLSTPDQAPQVMIATSALPQEGKTVTTINLAAAFTQLDKKVLIIDSDMRRPRLHKVFRLKNTAGFSSFLVGRHQLNEVIHTVRSEHNLDIIPAGPVPANPAELLNSRHLADTMKNLRKTYDFIFLDTPPLMAGSDAILLGAHADGILLIALSGKTSRKMIENARNEIEKFKIRLLGLILNKVNTRRLSSETYSYHYKYGGYSESADKREEG